MKFTKLTSSVLAGATLLSLLAPTASFAKTATGDANANGGTALPQTDKTTAGISFGDNDHNTNSGYLRLQMVPHVLDFGNHKVLDTTTPVFSATGKNDAKDNNDRDLNYESKGTNQTAILNTDDKDLSNVKNTAWATVVDKQVTRKNVDADNTAESGNWTLKVSSDNELTKLDDQGAATTTTIPDAHISFDKTQTGRTNLVHELTAEDKDATWTTDLAAAATKETPKAASVVSSYINLALDGSSKADVAEAKQGEGQGADVFGWTPANIKLTMPETAKVENAIYTANLTWTLDSTI
ncbi:WxL domain-containing protein [Latilactobacillus sakei]